MSVCEQKREKRRKRQDYTHSHTHIIAQLAVSCPVCTSDLLHRDGLRYLADGNPLQRWLCRKCGRCCSKDRPVTIRFGFAEYLETLNWEDVRAVHNVHLKTSVQSLRFVNDAWKHSKRQKSYSREELVDNKYRFTLTVFSQVMTLAVVVGCSNSPVIYDVEGLTRFHEVLCDVRAKYLDSSVVPKVCDWLVTQWHYGRDSKSSIAGLSFEVTFLDWFGNLVHIYTKGAASNGKIRMERIETPNETVARILDSVEDHIKKTLEGLTCVEDDVLNAVQRCFIVTAYGIPNTVRFNAGCVVYAVLDSASARCEEA